MYDTLEYFRRREAVGVPREQAETQVRILAEVINTNLATKQDLNEATRATNAKFAGMHAEFAMVRSELKRVEDKLLIRLSAVIVCAIGLLGILLKLGAL